MTSSPGMHYTDVMANQYESDAMQENERTQEPCCLVGVAATRLLTGPRAPLILRMLSTKISIVHS